MTPTGKVEATMSVQTIGKNAQKTKSSSEDFDHPISPLFSNASLSWNGLIFKKAMGTIGSLYYMILVVIVNER